MIKLLNSVSSKSAYKYLRSQIGHVIRMITQSPKIRGGKPVIEGTRVTVEDVAKRFYELEMSEDEIAEALAITEEQVEEALRYHYQQKRAITA